MPTADPFNAAGRRNGLPFTLLAATDSAINAVDGNTFASLSAEGVLRVKEFTFDNILPYIWNLYDVDFPTVSHGGVDHAFSSAGIYKIGEFADGYVNADALTPKERVVFSPGLTLSPLANGDEVASARATSDQDTFGRFDVHHICFATDTSKYYLMYMSGLYADDGVTLEVEIPFANLNFDYYTYT